MYCTNCGKQIEDGSHFCTGCGTPVAEQNTNAEAPAQQPEQQPASTAQTETPAQPASTQPTEQPAQQPQEAPVNTVSEQSVPANNIPPFNQAGNDAVSQPAQAQPTNGSPAGNPFQPIAEKAKKINPIIFILAGAVVAVVIIVVAIVLIVSNSGPKSVLNNMEKAVNDQDIDALYDCYPSFVAEDMDLDEDDIESSLGLIEGIKISCTLEDEEDITDEDYEYDDSVTWQEYIQEQYEDYDEYDDEEVEKVVEAEYTTEYSFDNDVADYIADAIGDEDGTEETGIFVKVDGDWYIYE